MAIAETVQSFLAERAVTFDLVPHPATYTSRDSAEAAHVPADHTAKAVIVEDARGYAMVVIPGDRWLKLHGLQDASGRIFSLAGEAAVDGLFGDCEPGAVPPLGAAYGLDMYLDEQLWMLADVYFEAGDHTHLVRVSGEGFHALAKGARRGHFSHAD